MKPLLVLIAVVAVGCASGGGYRTVPLARWQAVPADARAKTDAAIDAKLAAAQAEQTAAVTAVTEGQAALDRAATKRAPSGSRTYWFARLLHDEQRKADALALIDRTRVVYLQADLVWRQRRVEAAAAHVAMVEADRELQRAIVI